MIVAKIQVNGAIAKTVYRKVIPAGIIGAQVELDYDEDIWHGLHKTVVFKGAVTKDVITDANIVTIPHEVVEKPFFRLSIGVYGVDADGNIVIPTLWENIGAILDAAAPSGDISTDPSLPVWAQIQAMIGDLSNLTTTAKENLVAAINEAAKSGGGGGSASIAMRVDSGYIQYSTDDGKTWVNLIAEADLKGDKGDKGADGTDGITPHIGENGNWYIGSTDTGNPSRGATGPQGPAGAPGKDGADMGITGAKVGQIAKIAAVDASGVPAAWSPVDMPEALPNPNALTFTGAVTGSYDGSAPLEVSIPSGGGGTGGGGDVFELIGEATSSGVSDASGLTIPFDGSLYKTIIAYAYNLPAGNNKRIIIRTKKAWYDGYPMGWNTVIDTYIASLTNMNNTWGFFGAAIDVGGKLFTLGAAESNTNGGHGFFRFYPQNGAIPTLSLSGCKFISLDCNSSSEMLPDGCSLIVWGVRK